MTRTVGEDKRAMLARRVEQAVTTTPVYDVHTHLYDPALGELLLWGIDELLIYHYLIAEAFRYTDIRYDRFWALSKTEQAELVWKQLFLENSPVSEACRGVLTTLHWLGLDVRERDLTSLREWFSQWQLGDYITHCMKLAGIHKICMTNSPFDDKERVKWEGGFERDPRFIAAFRIDPLLLDWPTASSQLASWGYKVDNQLQESTLKEIRRFLEDWSKKLQAKYLMVSVPPDFDFPDDGPFGRTLEKAVLPHCRDHGLPLALMPGVKRAVNPQLKLAGDGVGSSKLESLANLCVRYPDNKFMATVLARVDQHELCVLARKFRNLHIFGCWWFTNVPSIIDEMTRMRVEMLGLSFTPQHSDARVLDQIIYKWQHSKTIIARVLVDKYSDLVDTGWEPTKEEIQRDVAQLFGGAFETFCG